MVIISEKLRQVSRRRGYNTIDKFDVGVEGMYPINLLPL